MNLEIVDLVAEDGPFFVEMVYLPQLTISR